MGKKVILVGDSIKAKEFPPSLNKAGVETVLISNLDRALAAAQSSRPDGIVFVLPVFWESVSSFVEKIRRDPTLAKIPIIYLGEFIEASDQIILKRQGVHTITLGPVPVEEITRFILSKI